MSVFDRERVGELLGLTPRESQLAVALAEGRTVSEVARETGRSVNTVRWHLQHIYTKLGLSRQAELVRAVMALASGLHGAARGGAVRSAGRGAPSRTAGISSHPIRTNGGMTHRSR